MGLGLPPIDSTSSKGYIPPGWKLDPATGELYYMSNPDGTGDLVHVKPGETIKYGGGYFTYDPQAGGLTTASESEIKRYNASTGGGGGGGYNMGEDPRYWQLQQDQLAAQYMNMGLDAESARRQAEATLIANRNNTAVSTAQTSADIAKQAAQFAANPRDTYAEAFYRNQVGGSTPFGDTSNSAFGEYGKALAQKAQDIFSPVNSDMNQLRQYRDAIPPVDFTSPSPAVQQITGVTPSSGGIPGTQGPLTPPPNTNADQIAQLQAYATYNPDDAAAQQRAAYAAYHPDAPQPFAKGGQIDVGDLTRFGGYQPSSSEGGTNMNIHEPAVLIGIHSGHHYATVAEGGYPEQIKITPTPAGKKAAMEREKAGKAQKDVMGKAFGTGGTISSSPSLDEMNNQYTQLLQRLGGPGGGSATPFAGTRFLAGAPANAILNDPYLKGITEAGYSARGIDPAQVWADVAKFTPDAIPNNAPRVNWA